MQINTPHRVFGATTYYPPIEIDQWLARRGLNAEYCGGGSWGNGYHADGTSNVESTYMVRNIEETDALAFKIVFPDCKIYSTKQYEYE